MSENSRSSEYSGILETSQVSKYSGTRNFTNQSEYFGGPKIDKIYSENSDVSEIFDSNHSDDSKHFVNSNLSRSVQIQQ